MGATGIVTNLLHLCDQTSERSNKKLAVLLHLAGSILFSTADILVKLQHELLQGLKAIPEAERARYRGPEPGSTGSSNSSAASTGPSRTTGALTSTGQGDGSSSSGTSRHAALCGAVFFLEGQKGQLQELLQVLADPLLPDLLRAVQTQQRQDRQQDQRRRGSCQETPWTACSSSWRRFLIKPRSALMLSRRSSTMTSRGLQT